MRTTSLAGWPTKPFILLFLAVYSAHFGRQKSHVTGNLEVTREIKVPVFEPEYMTYSLGKAAAGTPHSCRPHFSEIKLGRRNTHALL
jgi:hypothetical protein